MTRREWARGSLGAAAPDGKISGKDYARELKKLHVELVKLQEWVVHKGLKICVVFEVGRRCRQRPAPSRRSLSA